MQPENSQSGPNSVENLPMPPSQTPEFGTGNVPSLPSIETGLDVAEERHEQAAEAGAIASDAAASATNASAIAMPSAPVQAPTSDPTATTTPLIAANDDLIEKEWVDKAKEIIATTKDDPRARSDKVGGLRRNYQEKRFGKVVGAGK